MENNWKKCWFCSEAKAWFLMASFCLTRPDSVTATVQELVFFSKERGLRYRAHELQQWFWWTALSLCLQMKSSTLARSKAKEAGGARVDDSRGTIFKGCQSILCSLSSLGKESVEHKHHIKKNWMKNLQYVFKVVFYTRVRRIKICPFIK